ncbi:hypothetical protein SDC9_37477 [bioreactor metagenome]|uniref:Phage minor tail protein L n=1 Tax=bioreactor metagenome TaxID=1076179 RepID=A0A644VJ41_9ZZZZ|nr:DUF1833 family protein [Acidaminococcaceae bacterium]
MNNLSAAAKLLKNKLADDGAYLVLLEIAIYGTDIVLRLARNTDDVPWNGQNWQAFPFSLADLTETSDGEIPEVTLQVSNVERIVQGYVEQADGGGKSSATIRVVNSKLLTETEPLLEEFFTVTKTSCKEDYVYFTLGMGYKKARRPLGRYLKNHCSAKYGGCKCGVSAATMTAFTSCDHTLVNCRARGNSARFGGQPLVGQGGLYV